MMLGEVPDRRRVNPAMGLKTGLASAEQRFGLHLGAKKPPSQKVLDNAAMPGLAVRRTFRTAHLRKLGNA